MAVLWPVGIPNEFAYYTSLQYESNLVQEIIIKCEN